MKRRKRRRSYVVDKSLQYRFLALILIYGVVIVSFLALFLFVPDILRLENENLSMEVRAAAAKKLLTLHARVWPAVIALICVLGLHSFAMFHRLVGPLYRFRMVFGRVRDGDLSYPVKIREKDYLHKEEETLNEMLAVLAGKWGEIEQTARESLDSFRKFDEVVSQMTGWGGHEERLAQEHREHLERLADTAAYFRKMKSESGGEDVVSRL